MQGFASFVLRRSLQTVPTILTVITLNFLLIHLAPGDPAARFASGMATDPAYIARIRASMGLDKPLFDQFLIYLAKLSQGDLGVSLYWKDSVLSVIAQRVPNTMLLMAFGLALAILVGIPIGVEAARRPRTRWDYLVTSFSVAGYSIPVYWLGLILIILFAVVLKWLPSGGMISPASTTTGFDRVLEVLQHMILPGVTLAASQTTIISRLTRQCTVDALGENYILTARMKGLSPTTIAYKHAFRNAMLPVITVIGLQIGFFVSWSVLAEIVFAWPGVGLLLWWTIGTRDYPVLMGIFIVIAIMVIVADLFTDIIYARLDPRISYGEEAA